MTSDSSLGSIQKIESPTAGSVSPSYEQLVLYVPEMEEIRISPVVSRKGYLNILDNNIGAWKKRWVVRINIQTHTQFGRLDFPLLRKLFIT